MHFSANDKLLLSILLPTPASRGRLRQVLNGEIDWAASVRRAKFHQVAALLRFNLSSIGALDLMPQKFRAELDEASRAWAARHLAYTSEAKRLITDLRNSGITALPLKGAALMLGEYYPESGLRAALDIDLLIDPEKIELAQRIAEKCGYLEIPGRRDARPRQRLENERNHCWPRRGPSGLLLELHHRAFHYAQGNRDFGFAELDERAVVHQSLRLPSPADLALHLIHHTMVDWQSTHAVLRTLADLHFIFLRDAQAYNAMKARAREFGFAGAAEMATRALSLLAAGSADDLIRGAKQKDVGLLFETALMESPEPLANAARLFEYLDFGQSPIKKLGNLTALVFTPRSHLEQLYGKTERSNVYLNYLRRPFDLIKKLKLSTLRPANLWRVRKLRKIASRGE